MPDEPQTQTPPVGDPPATPPVPPTDPPTPPAGDPPEDAAGLKKALEAERAANAQAKRDAAAARKELEAATAKLKAAEDAEKTEAQKAVERAEAAEKRATELEAQVRSQSLRHAVASAARDQNFHNPDVAFKLLDLDEIKFDDDGTPQGIAEAVKKLATDHPYLVKTDAPRNGPPPTDRPTRPPNGLTPEAERVRLADFERHTVRSF